MARTAETCPRSGYVQPDKLSRIGEMRERAGVTFETVYMGLAGSLILVLIRLCLPSVTLVA